MLKEYGSMHLLRYPTLRLIGTLLALLVLPVAGVQAQSAEVPEAPVRYDADLLPPSFHQSRRAAVLEALPEDAVAVFFSTPSQTRENDVNFEYRQDSDLYYLTGTHEPGSVLFLAPGGITVEGGTVRELLLVPERNPSSETWTGRLFGPERAQKELGLAGVLPLDRYDAIITALAEQEDIRFFHKDLPSGVAPQSTLGRQLDLFREVANPMELSRIDNRAVRQAMYFINRAGSEEDFARYRPFARRNVVRDDLGDSPFRAAIEAFLDAESFDSWMDWKRTNLDTRYADGSTVEGILSALRMQKTDAELALLQRAIDITAEAHREAMRSMEPGMYEYEIEALIEYIFKRNGAEYTGFPSIVGSGENAVILHYETNRRQMQAEDMVVIDIGAEYHGYSADITRTAPVNGTFSPEQKIIYELVLNAQDAGIAATRIGASFSDPHRAAQRVIADGLKELGLIQTDEEVRTFFMHGTSHYLGLYVHDVGTGGELVPGTVITVEPGIYISPSPDIDPKWWNIGVRIEDDILVTDGGPLNLSAGAPRAVADVEALMRETGLGNEAVGVVGR